MVAARWFWVATLGSMLVLSAVAMPAAGWFMGGHGAPGPLSSTPNRHLPGGPGWSGTGYAATFTESGLPAGTNWTVSVWHPWSPGNGSAPSAAVAPAWWPFSNTSSNASIGFSLPNGTYNFSVSPAVAASGVFDPNPASGSLAVNGSSAAVSVAFSAVPMYPVTFQETGLPSGTFWTVSLVGGSEGYGGGFGGGYGGEAPAVVVPACQNVSQNGSNTTTITFLVPNGTYDFFVGNASTSSALYVPSPSAGNVSVNGSGATVPVAFTTVPLYALTFTESGLPAGTNWSVVLQSANGSWYWNESSAPNITFWVPNGTYNFSVENVSILSGLFVPSPSAGSVTVNGSGADVPVVFAAVPLYALTFTETGLPNGTCWSVVLEGGNGSWYWNGSSTPNVTFWVPNGSYNFSVNGVWTFQGLYVPSPANGTVVVDGAGVTVDVVFTAPAVYSVSFVESGLPNGTNWSVVLFSGPGPCAECLATPDWGGVTYNVSNGTTVNFTEPDGVYAFFVPVVCVNDTVYLPSPANGTVAVNGTGATVAITFAPLVVATVTFVESGLPNGTVWFVAMESDYGWTFGVSNNTTVGFVLPSGTYGFDIGPVWVDGVLYTPSPATVSETVSGAAITVSVTFTASG